MTFILLFIFTLFGGYLIVPSNADMCICSPNITIELNATFDSYSAVTNEFSNSFMLNDKLRFKINITSTDSDVTFSGIYSFECIFSNGTRITFWNIDYIYGMNIDLTFFTFSETFYDFIIFLNKEVFTIPPETTEKIKFTVYVACT